MSELTALIIGNGGREHAIADQIAPGVNRLYYTGTNAGMESLPNAMSIGDIDAGDFALQHRPSLTIIGPEQPLVDGVADQIRESGLIVCGPSQEAAQLESSKKFAREFMQRHDILTPAWTVVDSIESYVKTVERFSEPTDFVIKADGLAGGKGVILADTWAQANEVVGNMLTGKMLNGAGSEGVLIEERCHGPEISMFVITDGENYSILPLTQDHKRRNDGDQGDNTGGMGAYTYLEDSLTDRQKQKLQEIAAKSVEGAQADGMPFKGVLYVGAMLAEEYDGDPVVIEYNVRFGDPEAEVLLPLLGENTFDVLASTDGTLREDLLTKAQLAGQAALTVCLAAGDYPNGKSVNQRIFGLDRMENYPGVAVYHGGTKRLGNQVLTNGGRVLYVTGTGQDIDEAAARAYSAIDSEGLEGGIYFKDMHHRTDIGWQARNMTV